MIAQRNEAEHGSNTTLQSVRTITYVAEPFTIVVILRGHTEAKASVGAVADTAGIIDTVHMNNGDKIAIGDLLCTLDQGTRAAVAQAKAGLAQAQADFDTNVELRSKGLAAAKRARNVEVALSASKASVTAAEALVENAQTELDRTEIRVKVAGVIHAPLAVAGSMLP